MNRYQVVVESKNGLLLGGLKKVKSSWFLHRCDAEGWLKACQDMNGERISSSKIEIIKFPDAKKPKERT